MSFIGRIKSKLAYKFHSSMKPEIIGYSKWNGLNVKNLRISNLTHVSNRKNISFGDYVFVGHFNCLDGHSKVHIGEGVQITSYVSIVTHSSHNAIRVLGSRYEKYFMESSSLIKGDVEIGAFSYVGPHSVVMPGVKIGKGCIISAYSYVNHDVPDFAIVRGKSAKIIGDTRDIDNKYFEEFPNEKSLYFKDNL